MIMMGLMTVSPFIVTERAGSELQDSAEPKKNAFKLRQLYIVWVQSFIEMVMKVWRFLWKVSLFGFSQKHPEVEAR